MRLLLDTQVVVAVSRGRVAAAFPRFAHVLSRADHELTVSVASIWEIAIKVRIGKLAMDLPPHDLPATLRSFGMAILPIHDTHATEMLDPDPPTRDPFDRMLLAQCAVDGMRLVTVDRALVDHPLAWVPTP